MLSQRQWSGRRNEMHRRCKPKRKKCHSILPFYLVFSFFVLIFYGCFVFASDSVYSDVMPMSCSCKKLISSALATNLKTSNRYHLCSCVSNGIDFCPHHTKIIVRSNAVKRCRYIHRRRFPFIFIFVGLCARYGCRRQLN